MARQAPVAFPPDTAMDEHDRAWGLYVVAAKQSQKPGPGPRDAVRLSYVVRGTAVLKPSGRRARTAAAGSEREVQAGDVVLLSVRDDMYMQGDAARGCLMHQIDFAGDQAERMLAVASFAPLPAVIRAGFDEHLLSLVAEIIELGRLRPAGWVRLQAGALAHLLARLDVAHRQSATIDRRHQLVQEARMLLVDPGRDRLDLGSVAQEMGVGYSTFRRTFRAKSGTTPHQYRLGQRLAHAQRLLADTDMPIAAIAEELGFSSQAYFARLFRSKTGLSPSVWRENQPKGGGTG